MTEVIQHHGEPNVRVRASQADPERDPLADEPDVEPTAEGPEGSEADIPASGEPGEDHAVDEDAEVPF